MDKLVDFPVLRPLFTLCSTLSLLWCGDHASVQYSTSGLTNVLKSGSKISGGNGSFYHAQHSISFIVCCLTIAGRLQIVTMTPKFFSSLLLAKTWPFNSYWNSWLPLPMCRTLHLDVLNSICHFLEQSANDVRSRWRLKQFLSLETEWKIFMSSANFKILLRRPSSISLMKTRNNSGPKSQYWALRYAR